MLARTKFSLLCENFLSSWSNLLSSRIFIFFYTLILRIKWISSCEVIIRLCKSQIILEKMVRLLTLLPQTLIGSQRVIAEETCRSGVKAGRVPHHFRRRNECFWISQLVMHASCILYLWIIKQILNECVVSVLGGVGVEQHRVHLSDLVSQVS